MGSHSSKGQGAIAGLGTRAGLGAGAENASVGVSSIESGTCCCGCCGFGFGGGNSWVKGTFHEGVEGPQDSPSIWINESHSVVGVLISAADSDAVEGELDLLFASFSLGLAS